jgi:type III restriction enzyme
MASRRDMPLAYALTARVEEACVGLAEGRAPILGQVSDTTAALLRHWFGQDAVDVRAFNFHAGQRRAILNAIYAHEVLGGARLADVYEAVAPEALLDKAQDLLADKHAHPKYCIKMATGTGKTWVLQALLVWQALNAVRAPEDLRFTRNFLVVAPGLIVYDRLLDAFFGKERDGVRDFETSDMKVYGDLFVPENHRAQIGAFVQGVAYRKEDIGRKITGGGFIGITNEHAMREAGEEEQEEDSINDREKDYKSIAKGILPVSPGRDKGNDLGVLDGGAQRGAVLRYLAALPSLMVFNDEAHHIHETKKGGEVDEVLWQKSLTAIAAPKRSRFVQVDFSATPYRETGKRTVTGADGQKKEIVLKDYFPHIIVDFDLKEAMREGLVKAVTLDKRREIAALDTKDLAFKAERGDDGTITLSEGQRLMLRAGLTKLRKLEADFAALDPARHPKMLVVCEDTNVAPLVVDFLQEEGLAGEDVLRVDSNRKGEVKEEEWRAIRERLFGMDGHATPRVVVSVLMLREGFDVNNICVIVPLRTAGAQQLLEQTIGRGLRLMWRGEERFEEERRENRRLLREGHDPQSLIDVLSIVEHPNFQSWYDELISEGLVGEEHDDAPTKNAAGDLITVDLREGYEAYDFAWPVILQEREETLSLGVFDPATLAPFTGLTLEKLKAMIGSGERFVSHDVQTGTQFGDYRVDGGVMTATGYNDYLGRMARRIGHLMSQPLTKSNRRVLPHIPVARPQLAGWVDGYIRRGLFGQVIDPMEDENWRVLLHPAVVEHAIRTIARKLLEVEGRESGAAEVEPRLLSEVNRLLIRQSASVAVSKCIYPALPYPLHGGGLERAFIEMADRDAGVEAFCKLQHDFTHLRYIKEDGLPGFYAPDFLVRTREAIFVVETKAQEQLAHPNIQRKKKAALAWCERVNDLPPGQRSNRLWCYVLLGEALFYEWRGKNAGMTDTLKFAVVREADYMVQERMEV